jgi:site-specific recombinase XerD
VVLIILFPAIHRANHRIHTVLDLIPAPAAAGALITLDNDRAALDLDLQAGKAPSTRQAYASDGKAFATWCRARGLDPLLANAETVALHLSSCASAGLAPSSLGRRVAGIAYFLQLAGVADDVLPTRAKLVRETLAGIRRRHPKPSRRKDAATTDIVRAMLDTCGDDLQGLRDRALLALGFAGALRRSELVAVDLEDLAECPDGYRLTVRRSKTDQEGLGYVIPIGRGARIRPVEAVQDWIQAAGITGGALLLQVHRGDYVLPRRLTSGMVALVIKRRARLAGLDPRPLSGHSLRAGFCTSAAMHGANVFRIMDVTRHQSMDTLRGYVRERDMFKDYAGAAIL